MECKINKQEGLNEFWRADRPLTSVDLFLPNHFLHKPQIHRCLNQLEAKA